MKYAQETVTFTLKNGESITYKNAYVYACLKKNISDGFKESSVLAVRVPGADNKIPPPGSVTEYEGTSFAVVFTRKNYKGLRPHLLIEARG